MEVSPLIVPGERIGCGMKSLDSSFLKLDSQSQVLKSGEAACCARVSDPAHPRPKVSPSVA